MIPLVVAEVNEFIDILMSKEILSININKADPKISYIEVAYTDDDGDYDVAELPLLKIKEPK